MSITDSEIKQAKSNSAALTATWFILIAALTLLSVSIYFLSKNNKLSKSQTQLHLLIENQQIIISEIADELNSAIEDNGAGSLPFKTEILEKLTASNSSLEQIQNPVFTDELDEAQKTKLKTLIVPLNKTVLDFNGIVKLILDKKKGVRENEQIIKNQLLDSREAYFSTLKTIEFWYLNQLSNSNEFNYQFQLILSIAYLLLALLGYLKVIKPLGKNFKETQNNIKNWKLKINASDEKLEVIVQKEKTNALILKTKIAQVQKLQESLEITLNESSKAKQDKNLVYFNAATDLSGFINVMNQQQEIIENQTDVSKNTNWLTLTGSISQLNILVEDYFNRAKIGFSHQNQSEVYLSQLLSEILLSISNPNGVVFEQVSDMPTIKTNANLFKRVIQPYFEMIANCKQHAKVKISAVDNGETCELRFIGLAPEFQEKWNKMGAKELVNLSFDEFKIHMSKNAINERGGSQWLQFDQSEKGVFHVSWIL